jgi:hypothetical protein
VLSEEGGLTSAGHILGMDDARNDTAILLTHMLPNRRADCFPPIPDFAIEAVSTADSARSGNLPISLAGSTWGLA